jgi:hypothetical protein
METTPAAVRSPAPPACAIDALTIACAGRRQSRGNIAATAVHKNGRRERMRTTTSTFRKSELTTAPTKAGSRLSPRYCCTAMESDLIMPRDNSVGVFSGLLLVAVVLAMIGSFRRVSAVVHGPVEISGYELAGSSRPAP